MLLSLLVLLVLFRESCNKIFFIYIYMMFIREYLFSWRHLEIDSVLLLRLLALSPLIIKSFSIQLRPWAASFLFFYSWLSQIYDILSQEM